MNATMNGLSDQMKRSTERFLSRAVRSIRDPRAEYEKFLRELRMLSETTSETNPPPLPQRRAA